jgi:hypothetical protein
MALVWPSEGRSQTRSLPLQSSVSQSPPSRTCTIDSIITTPRHATDRGSLTRLSPARLLLGHAGVPQAWLVAQLVSQRHRRERHATTAIVSPTAPVEVQ